MPISLDVGRQRELKWLDMFSHWDKWLSRRFQKVSKHQCQISLYHRERPWLVCLVCLLLYLCTTVTNHVFILLKVKLRCRKGIPSSLRARAWQLLSNSKELLDQNVGKFEVLPSAFLGCRTEGRGLSWERKMSILPGSGLGGPLS